MHRHKHYERIYAGSTTILDLVGHRPDPMIDHLALFFTLNLLYVVSQVVDDRSSKGGRSITEMYRPVTNVGLLSH